MKSTNLFSKKEQLSQIETTAFSQELLRELIIPDLLGEDYDEIIYIAGKRLARNVTIESKDELINFFDEAGWGTLEIIKEKKKTTTYELKGPIVTARFSYKKDPSFNLEAGFLAEQVQQQTGTITEATYSLKHRNQLVTITVQSE
ncbi:YslB family protein [Bacillus solimangrovi]|uniref:DUF2507 domain-containing protein n=1 Tax=Bacillus solimangrovi TaxID=1305675 RepID=A0A1E5LCV3_9BACI|nr:YslB family protein [Bacillus solimangrovi]OEH91904.1 hypothetical protein BFG57_04000 [Bacillus solimangrovi]